MKVKAEYFIYPVILLTGLFFLNTACKKDSIDNKIVEKQGLSIPAFPSPENNSVGQNTNLLEWKKCTDSLTQSAVVYDLFFGTNPNPGLLFTGIATDDYLDRVSKLVGILQCNTKYYWKVEAYDDRERVTGPVWNFTTKTSTVNDYRDRFCGNFIFRVINWRTWDFRDTAFYHGYVAKTGIPDTLLFIRYSDSGNMVLYCDSIFGSYFEPVIRSSGELLYPRLNQCSLLWYPTFNGLFYSNDSLSFSFNQWHLLSWGTDVAGRKER